jgi:D-beta-D-heptose 7-phosphate kinase/D-beta-D-heptose 1-phosphate adenosyltransferase
MSADGAGPDAGIGIATDATRTRSRLMEAMRTDENDLAQHVAAFRNRRVLVLGDAILDEYITGDCSRISPEAPVPILKVHACRRVLGGAANTAANIRSLGGEATLIALVGADEGGVTLERCASDAGIDLRGITHPLPTLRKTRVVAQQQQIVRLDFEESPAAVPRTFESAALRLLDDCLPVCDIVVVSDYAKGFLSRELSQTIVRRAHRAGRAVIADPRPQNRDCYSGCDYLTPNWREARGLLRLGDAEPSEENISSVAGALANELRTNVLLTLGAHGIAFRSRNGAEQFALPTLAREVFDVSGAGDTVVATFALARAAGADHRTAAALANRAASVVVGKLGTATVTPEEMFRDGDAHRVVPRNALSGLAVTLRQSGKRIVTINGCFDLLHAGHLHMLDEARKQGDVLIVGLNSDASVRRYKGTGRPIVPEEQRARMLLALRMVDYVHVFSENDPIAFLAEIQPDVHVNGSEYGEYCIEREAVIAGGGRIHVVNRLPDLSTTDLLAHLQSAAPAVSTV